MQQPEQSQQELQHKPPQPEPGGEPLFHVRLQNYLLLPFVFLFLLAMVAVLILTGLQNYRSIQQLHDTLHQQIAARVTERLDDYLSSSQRVLYFNQLEVERQLLESRDLDGLKPLFWEEMSSFPDVDAIFVGLADDEFFGYARFDDTDIEAMEAGESTGYNIVFSQTNLDGSQGAIDRQSPDFRATVRPWYREAEQTEGINWGGLFNYQAPPHHLVLPASVKLLDTQGNLVGVIGINLFLERFDEFLTELNKGTNGQVMILDQQGKLVASSRRSDQLEQVTDAAIAAESKDPVVQAFLEQSSGQDMSDQGSFDLLSYSALITPFRFNHNLKWQIVTLVDKGDYLEPLTDSYRTTVVIAVVILLFIFALLSMLNRRLLNPLLNIYEHIRAFSRVEDGKTMTLASLPTNRYVDVKEISLLYRAINTMQVRISQYIRRQTEDNQRLNAFANENRKLAKVVQQTDNAVILADKNGLITWVNIGFEHLTGYELGAVIGRRPGDLLQGPETDASVIMEMGVCVRNGRPFDGIILNYRRDGEPYWTRLSIEPVFDEAGELQEYFSIQADITETILKEQQLTVYKRIFESAHWGIAVSVSEEEPIFELVNPQFAAMVQMKPDELLGQPLTSVYAPGFEEQVNKTTQRLQDVGFTSVESKLVRKDGTEFPAQITVSAVTDHDRNLVFRIAHIQDLSEVHDLERQLRQSQKLESLGMLAGGVVHDFNNILAAMMVNAEMATLLTQQNAVEGGEDVVKYLDNIVDSGEKAAELIKQILLFSRKESHNVEPVSLRDVAESVKVLIQAKLPSHVNLVLTIEDEGDYSVMGNKSQLHQVVLNLLTNALSAVLKAERKRGTIELSLGAADQSEYSPLRDIRDWVSLRVKDNGIGIDSNLKEKIFDPFFTTKGEGDGTGLGLSIVTKIIDQHKGYIRCESEPGDWTSFTLYFPLQERDNGATNQAKELKNRGLPMAGMSVLMVDDDASLTGAWSELLKRQGLTVVTYNDPVAAVKHFNETPDTYDLVVTDMQMPDLDGRMLARNVKARRPELPVIMVAGFPDQAMAELESNHEINSLLIKPVSSEQLKDACLRVLKRQKAG